MGKLHLSRNATDNIFAFSGIFYIDIEKGRRRGLETNSGNQSHR